ncbi:MAG: hypothetical protein IKB79_03995 [Oscillospiraceae bacterium]|nr:hypothetical protein [Oscillospiraceae bacterium]
MQEIIIGTKTCRDEQDTLHTFQYSLLVRHIPAGRFAFEEYGVAVVHQGGDCVRIPGITHSRTRIDALMELLMEHMVSPTELCYVVADWAKENHLPQPELQQVVEVQ